MRNPIPGGRLRLELTQTIKGDVEALARAT